MKTAAIYRGRKEIKKWQRFCATTLVLAWLPRARASLWAGRPPTFWLCAAGWERQRKTAAAEDLSRRAGGDRREILRNDEELRRREQTAPGVEHDVVAIHDNAGIPPSWSRFRRVTNKELSAAVARYTRRSSSAARCMDEIYISVYENTMINGKLW